jgi:hypothetical protein
MLLLGRSEGLEGAWGKGAKIASKKPLIFDDDGRIVID